MGIARVPDPCRPPANIRSDFTYTAPVVKRRLGYFYDGLGSLPNSSSQIGPDAFLFLVNSMEGGRSLRGA